MRLLFFSDQHEFIGPPDPIRPGMRRFWCRLGYCGQQFMDRVDDRLRAEAARVKSYAQAWIEEHWDEYDIVVDGGDVAMPLNRHRDRMKAVRKIWTKERDRWGEPRFIALTGNHELGHGFTVESAYYADLMELRRELFSDPINRAGYGVRELEQQTLLFVDSEILQMVREKRVPRQVIDHYLAMKALMKDVAQAEKPVAIMTHNTVRVMRWIHKLELWADLVNGGRQVLFVGGHYHMPRKLHRDGATIYWVGGGSYPEVYLRYLTKAPVLGLKNSGPGALEIDLSSPRIRAEHKSFSVPLPLLRGRSKGVHTP